MNRTRMAGLTSGWNLARVKNLIGRLFRSGRGSSSGARPAPDGQIDREGGAAGANAAMAFFSLLQKSVLDRRSRTAREKLRIAIVTWIERTCHRRRRQAALGRLTPVAFETVMTTLALQAVGPNLSPKAAPDPGVVPTGSLQQLRRSPPGRPELASGAAMLAGARRFGRGRSAAGRQYVPRPVMRVHVT